ncbi:Arginyltransferase [Beijerinckia indica subsp. indica ATCC 9039]|uniref:Aspartate/glutamate leucyltransferase n=1 Tax=Beijerinckia indica subsp. indica (strain ATCC 9039 / DSM 1715 / NCIMB 8712) TaxID=395963 RepID=B2IJ83_BEII9|nr:Arginyltransferase [Beijerinckia indica subsp. indica ATCC 9039]
MNKLTREPRDAPQFYLTAPSPCPYLPDQQERKVFTHLIGRRAVALNDHLTQSGFRRSQTIAYRPACEHCRACISVRIKVDEFESSKNLRRIRDRNRDLTSTVVRPEPTTEQYSLFRSYLDARHSDGGMADMTILDYSMMIEDSHVESRLVEYRSHDAKAGHGEGPLTAVCLTDMLSDGLSMVYSFYTPRAPHRSLGTYMILDHIERARRLGLPHVYLGYWVQGSRKMAYKARFLPQERLGLNGWERVETNEDDALEP